MSGQCAPRPWRLDRSGPCLVILDADGERVARIDPDPTAEANARAILTLVNFCLKFPEPKAMGEESIPALLDIIRELREKLETIQEFKTHLREGPR